MPFTPGQNIFKKKNTDGNLNPDPDQQIQSDRPHQILSKTEYVWVRWPGSTDRLHSPYPVESTILPAGRTGSRVTIEATYKFSKHGTYFLTLRVASQRDGNAKIPYTRIQNLDRVRIVIK